MTKYKRKIFTSVFLFSKDRKKILLGMKKRGFGKGWWNGFGGKVVQDETIIDGAIRELQEETSIHATNLTKRGVIEFEFVTDPTILQVHVYEVNQYHGEPKESEEMIPKWFNVNQIPFDTMWPDDEVWFPYLINKKNFEGYFLFEDHTKIISYTVREIDLGCKPLQIEVN